MTPPLEARQKCWSAGCPEPACRAHYGGTGQRTALCQEHYEVELAATLLRQEAIRDRQERLLDETPIEAFRNPDGTPYFGSPGELPAVTIKGTITV